MPEVFPPSRIKFAHDAVRILNEDSPRPGDHADLRHGNSADLPGDSLAGTHREQQLIIFPTVKSEVEIDLPRRPAYSCTRDQLSPDFRPDTAFFADVSQIGRESVAGIDHRSGQLFLAQNPSKSNTRLRIKVARIIAGIQLLPGLGSHFNDSGRGATQFSTHINSIARTSP